MLTPKPALKILEGYRKIVWKEVGKYLRDPAYPHLFKIPGRYQADKNLHWRAVTDYPNRQGKYLRPTLLLLTCQAMGGNLQKALKTAAAMQLSEDWLLIHDDLEDNSGERRGKPTLHRIFGPELAINAGDMLQVIMWKVLADNQKRLGFPKTQQIFNEFYVMLARTCLGQSVEINWAKTNKINFTDNDWFFIADGKTSYYTIAGPMRLGAIVAGANKKNLEAITKFGIRLGRCFQIVDDILDLTSDFAGLKKQVGNDIWEGKRTIILGHLLRTAKNADRKKIISILKKSREKKTAAEVTFITQKISEYKSIDYAKEIADKLRNSALKIFEKDLKFLSTEPARSKIRTLIHFVLERDR